MPTWNHWEFNEALEGVATAEEIRDIAEGISLKGGFIEFNPEGRQAFRDAHVASKAEQARRRAEHNAWQAAKDAEALKNPPCCPYFVDDEKLAELLGDDLTHPDHPLHRQQLGSWDTELPDEEEDLESDSWDHDSKN